MDDISRRKLETANRTMALLTTCCKRRFLIEEMLPGRWNSHIETNNTEHYPIPFQSALEKKEMIPGGWISQRKAANTQHHPGLIKYNMEEKEMIPVGWNRQRVVSNNQQDSGFDEGPTNKTLSHRFLKWSRIVVQNSFIRV